LSDKPAPGNGNGGHTFVQAVVKLGNSVVAGLGPQALALLLFNAGILLLLFWFVDARAKHSMAIINQLLAACLSRQ